MRKRPVKAFFEKLPELPGREMLERWGVSEKWRRIFLFWQVSASAWLIDAGCLMLLAHVFGVPVFLAALVSPLPAFLWGFMLSTYKIYFREKGFSRTRFFYYAVFNLTMMTIAAYIISAGAKMGFWPVAVKISLAPLTFFINYTFTRHLLKPKVKAGASARDAA